VIRGSSVRNQRQNLALGLGFNPYRLKYCRLLGTSPSALCTGFRSPLGAPGARGVPESSLPVLDGAVSGQFLCRGEDDVWNWEVSLGGSKAAGSKTEEDCRKPRQLSSEERKLDALAGNLRLAH